MDRTASSISDETAITAERAVHARSRTRPSGDDLALMLQRQAGNAAVAAHLFHTPDEQTTVTVLRSSSLPNGAGVQLMSSPTVMRDARETRIRERQASLAGRHRPSGEPLYGCYMNLLLILDAARGVRPRTTLGQVEQWRRAHSRATGGTVSDIVGLLRREGIARQSRWFSYPRTGRKRGWPITLDLQGDPEGWVRSRARGGKPAYFAVSFRDIHSAFILLTSGKQVLWLDQFGEQNHTGDLNTWMSHHLDGWIEADRKHWHAKYKSTKITELRF